jgi:hypothetical protein
MYSRKGNKNGDTRATEKSPNLSNELRRKLIAQSHKENSHKAEQLRTEMKKTS